MSNKKTEYPCFEKCPCFINTTLRGKINASICRRPGYPDYKTHKGLPCYHPSLRTTKSKTSIKSLQEILAFQKEKCPKIFRILKIRKRSN